VGEVPAERPLVPDPDRRDAANGSREGGLVLRDDRGLLDAAEWHERADLEFAALGHPDAVEARDAAEVDDEPV
jgi:hypothetical protein